MENDTYLRQKKKDKEILSLRLKMGQWMDTY